MYYYYVFTWFSSMSKRGSKIALLKFLGLVMMSSCCHETLVVSLDTSESAEGRWPTNG